MDAMHLDLSAAWASVRGMAFVFLERLPYLVIAGLTYAVFHLAGRYSRRIIGRFTRQQRKHHAAALVLGRLAEGGMMLLGLLIALVIALPSFKPAQLVQLLGIGGVAIGFAFRDILQNFLAGILILLNEPFRIGDQIIISGFEGTVEAIETRATFIRTYDGRRVVIPNATLFNDSVMVNTAYADRRLQYDFGIGYGDDVEAARRIILQTLAALDEVLDDPSPDCLMVDLADSTVNLRARWWIKPPRRADVMISQDRVLTAVKAALTTAGIDLPYPTRQVLLHDQTEETDGDRRRQREGWPAVSP